MKICIAQMDMKLDSPQENFAHAETLICRAAEDRPDVILLPETWNTGFRPHEGLAAFCDRDGAATQRRIGALAREHGVNIVAGSVSVLRGEHIFNTAYVFDRGGVCIAQYDKTHLFTYGNEDKYYTPGGTLCIFSLDGVKCGLVTCYDIRFPEFVRTLALSGIEVLFVPAQRPDVRRYHWETLLAARAIENQIFIAACNSCASDTHGGGSSRILDPLGSVLAALDTTEGVLSADIDLSVLADIRATINVYRDRRPELYQVSDTPLRF